MKSPRLPGPPRGFVFALLLSVVPFAAPAAPPWGDLMRKSDDWFRGIEGRRTVTNVLSWQTSQGDWPKNTDTAGSPFTGDRAKSKGTFDNGSTTAELRFLARAFRATRDSGCEQAFSNGLHLILKAQYPNGGWPQYFPPPATSYHRHITFNDDAMARLMEFARDVATKADFDFVDAKRRQEAGRAFDRGVQCILKCQVVVDGRRTVWCAQHDVLDLSPRPARSYELVSLSGAESARLLQLLMSLDRPGPEVVRAVRSGAEWFDAVKLTGIRQTKVDGDKRILKDAGAPPLWARFYEIGSNRPMFSGRDGVKKYEISEIEPERRNGYSWYGDWGAAVARAYADWKLKWGGQPVAPVP